MINYGLTPINLLNKFKFIYDPLFLLIVFHHITPGYQKLTAIAAISVISAIAAIVKN